MSQSVFRSLVQKHLDVVTAHVMEQLRDDEQVTLNLVAEDTLYVRFNGNRVRQNTDVEQITLTLTLQSRGRTVEKARTLSGRRDVDFLHLTQLLQRCRDEVTVLAPDPNQVPVANNGSSEENFAGSLLKAEEVVESIVGPASACDLAGLYAGGVVVRANRNSAGQNHWFSSESFFLDYSLYSGHNAAKGKYAGSHWSQGEWIEHLARTRGLLQLLGRTAVNVAPGQYRTYLAPRAFSDLLGIMGWNALSAAAWQQGRSPFKVLAEGKARLSPMLNVGENFSLGLSPRFNNLGEISPVQLPLIERGNLGSLLVNSRSSKEYGMPSNAANESESPRSLDVAPGTLAQDVVLRELGTGLYLSNLHYLNWSDPVSARVTGMTRYACFWVKDGQIEGPIQDLRWDESLLDALGSKLLALTNWTELDTSVDTYGMRALGGARTPGALIDKFTFTL